MEATTPPDWKPSWNGRRSGPWTNQPMPGLSRRLGGVGGVGGERREGAVGEVGRSYGSHDSFPGAEAVAGPRTTTRPSTRTLAPSHPYALSSRTERPFVSVNRIGTLSSRNTAPLRWPSRNCTPSLACEGADRRRSVSGRWGARGRSERAGVEGWHGLGLRIRRCGGGVCREG